MSAPVPALMNMGKMDFQGYLLSFCPVPAEEVDQLIPDLALRNSYAQRLPG